MWFWPWYISWLIPFAALAGVGHLRTATALYATSGLVFYGLAPQLPPPFAGLEGYIGLVCSGPVLFYLFITYLKGGWLIR